MLSCSHKRIHHINVIAHASDIGCLVVAAAYFPEIVVSELNF
jgi:hypothetical protein